MHNAFGAFTRNRRIHLGLPIREVAKALGLTMSFVSQVECGKRYPYKEDKLATLSRTLNIPLSVLQDKAQLSRGVKLIARNEQEEAVVLALEAQWATMSSIKISRILDILKQ